MRVSGAYEPLSFLNCCCILSELIAESLSVFVKATVTRDTIKEWWGIVVRPPEKNAFKKV